MLTDLKTILTDAKSKGYAVPAFNTYNMETAMGVIRAAQEKRSPVIMQVYSRLFDGGEAEYLAPVILKAAEKADVPVCFHLDHGASMVEVTRALRFGCTGIMLDASTLDMAGNVAATREAVETCGHCGIPVEGEIGHVGKASDGVTDVYTTVDEAVEFANATGVAALAVQVGTAHGRYKLPPRLALDRIGEIARAVPDVAVVLHGGSGIPDDQIQASIKAGIAKINFGTDLCYAFLDQVFATGRDKVAIDLFMKDAISAVAAFAGEKIELLGAVNRA